MKNILTGLAITFSISLFGQVSILEENFDSTTLPASWTIIDNDGKTVDDAVQEYTNAWIYKEDPLNIGNGTASSTSSFSPVNRADRWLITPQITLGAESNFISWKGLSHDASFPDSYKVMVSRTGTTIADFTDTLVIINNETPYWSTHTELLDDYAYEQIYIAFVNTTYNGFKLYLDSVYVREQDPLAISNEELNIGVFPNPVATSFYVSSGNSTIHNVMVHNSFGQEVFVVGAPFQKNELKIDASNLPSGVYIVSIVTSDGVVQRKILKQ